MSRSDPVVTPDEEVTGPIPAAAGPGPGSALAVAALSALFAASLLLLAAGYAAGAGPVRLAGVFGALFFGVGTAPLQLSRGPSLSVRLGVAGVTGLSVLTLVGSAMVLAPVWLPLPATLIIGLAAVMVHLQAIREVLPQLRRPGALQPLRTGLGTVTPSLVCTVTGTILWLGTLLQTSRITPGTWGFLPHVSLLWYAGLALVLTGVVLAFRASEAHGLAGLVSLVSALTLTPAMVYGMPRAQTAAQHVDLVQLILQQHFLDRGVNIYEAYSGFFSGIAWVCAAAGVHNPLGLATYWPFVIGLIGLAELRFFFGRFARSGFQILAAMTLAVLVTAMGTDYFSPQSVGYVLGLGIFGLALGRDRAEIGGRLRAGLLVLAGCALAVTHQLSPFIVGGVLIVLVLFRVLRPWWVPAACLAPAALWALLNRPVLTGFLSLHDIGNLSNFLPPPAVSAPGLERLPIVAETSYALLLGIAVLIAAAGAGLLRTVRTASSWAYLISAGVGVFLLLANPYGNEGIFRAALFGIPWLAVLAMTAIGDSPPSWVTGVSWLASLGLAVTFLTATFGLDDTNVIRRSDLSVLQAYERHAPASSYLLDLSYGDIPTSVTVPALANNFEWTDVVTHADVRLGGPTPADAAALAHRYFRYAADNGGSRPTQLYALWSPASARYAIDYGLETPAQTRRWPRLLAASPDWRLVAHQGGTYLFRAVIRPAGR